MKKVVLMAAAAMILCAGCAGIKSCSAPAKPCTGKKIKTAFFIDRGGRGGGVIHLARLLSYSPEIELTLVKGEDMRKGVLKNFDLFVMPGGSSQLEMVSMKPEGVKALQDFIRNGGAYVGICAGYHITLNRPERAQLFPYTYMQEAVGYKADVLIEMTPEALKTLDLKKKKYFVRYSRGPVSKPASWDKGACKTLALYKSSVGPLNRAGKSFFNTPALIYGNYGKGKVIATSFHPEYRLDTYEIFQGLVYAVTGTKINPRIPGSKFRPLQVAYASGVAMSKDTAIAIRDVVALEKSNEINLMVGLSHEALAMADVLVLPETTEAAVKGFVNNDWPKFLKKFMDKGRKVVAVGTSWNALANHKNLIRIGEGVCLVESVVEAGN